MGSFLSRFPTQIWLAGGQCLVQASHGCRVGSGFDDLRVRARLLGDLVHDGDEVVQRLAGLRLGWLDHHRLVHDQGEVDGGRVHAEIEQAFGDIQGRDATLVLLALRRGDKLVLAGLRVGDLIIGRQFVLEIVRVEDGTLRQHAASHRGRRCECRYRHAPARRSCPMLARTLPMDCGPDLLPVVALLVLRRQGTGQECYQCSLTPIGPAPGPPPP